ncbi:WD40 repeat-like protein [Exidia glandulosa HHB12029]|uniref:WD40 repeat-like protein n=1 Tax=Exidia glandulosa HHB12029 TaxID=1314781 RepID=A0A165CI89_EXIGL|nr:WD40 repeat-like protein [Exidia glandulosa HHB12029]
MAHTLQYEAPWPVYGLDWCKTTGSGPVRGKSYFRLALASFTEDYRNRISIVGLADERSLVDDEPGEDFVPLAQTMHGYPPTKIQWQPASAAGYQWTNKSLQSELLATSGDCLRVWEYTTDNAIKTENYVGGRPVTNGHKLAQKIALSGQAKASSPTSGAPLTSFSWNTLAPSMIVTASIDTTCTVWDINTSQAITQLIAHDREVYDVAWLPGSTDIFVSVGADGSLRAFDLRNLDHSTILYETPPPQPPTVAPSSPMPARPLASSLMRIAFNPADSNYMATFHVESSNVQVLDMRSPGQPVVELKAHAAQVNALGWSVAEAGMLATAGDDCQLLMWDLSPSSLTARNIAAPNARLNSPRPDPKQRRVMTDPILAYSAAGEINNIAWSAPIPAITVGNSVGVAQGEWLAVAMGKTVKVLKT